MLFRSYKGNTEFLYSIYPVSTSISILCYCGSSVKTKKLKSAHLLMKGFLSGSALKNLPAMQETQEMRGLGRSPEGGNDNPLQKVLARKAAWTEETGRLQSGVSQLYTTEHSCT